MAENGICVRENKVKILFSGCRGKTQRKKTVITINQLYNRDWFRHGHVIQVGPVILNP